MTTDTLRRYRAYCKPGLADLLEALKLDRCFARARGNYLYDETGVAYLDMVGGFGAALLGHNYPELVQVLIESLEAGVPAHAQASPRGEAARLAEKLNMLIQSNAGYYVNFTNSGAESVEAAIKHAYKVHLDRLRRDYERVTRACNDLCARVAQEGLRVELPGDERSLAALRKALQRYNEAELEAFRAQPVIVALKGSFHGKTCTALKVTFNEAFRQPFEGLSAVRPVFIDMRRPEELAEAVAQHRSEFRYPVLEGQQVLLRCVRATRVAAFILEPILGEGGIREVPGQALKAFAELHATLKVPFILDEVQTGCGRTGSICYYTQTPLRGIEPEYITLSKALGGGLVKIGATLIKKSVYDQDFGHLHTSTFGEDELSCRVASRYLDLLTLDDGKLLKQVVKRGSYLRRQLEWLRRRYPSIVTEVRGRGLMLAVELGSPPCLGPFFRAASGQGVLSLLIASYLLAHHHIRLLAPLSPTGTGSHGRERPSVLRIQPPLTVTEAEIDRLATALDEVFNIIAHNNEYCLLGHLSGHSVTPAMRRAPKCFPGRRSDGGGTGRIDGRVGFVVHPTRVEDVVSHYFPSFEHYGWERAAFARWWNALARFLEPEHIFRGQVHSRGRVLEHNLILVPHLPEHLAAPLSSRKRQEVRTKIQDAVTLAKGLGDEAVPTTMVGLGGYTSILTNNGETINDEEVSVTTGNAYTAALVLAGIDHAAARLGLDVARAEAAVVGATGNIGLVLAQALSRKVGRLRLVGRPGENGLFRLRHVRRECLQEILGAIHRERRAGRWPRETRLGELGRAINTAFLAFLNGRMIGLEAQAIRPSMESDVLRPNLGKSLDALLGLWLEGAEDSLIVVDTSLQGIKGADIVAVATNSPDPELIRPEHVKEGAIVCCASVPSNLSPEFGLQQDRYVVFDGGLARLPDDSRIDFPGMPGGGLVYGCLAETLILGFEGQRRSFSKGLLRTEQVERAIAMAARHGFELGEVRLVGGMASGAWDHAPASSESGHDGDAGPAEPDTTGARRAYGSIADVDDLSVSACSGDSRTYTRLHDTETFR